MLVCLKTRHYKNKNAIKTNKIINNASKTPLKFAFTDGDLMVAFFMVAFFIIPFFTMAFF